MRIARAQGADGQVTYGIGDRRVVPARRRVAV